MWLGRDSDIAVEDPMIHPRHARFEIGGEGVTLIPGDSPNGVFVRLDQAEGIDPGAVLLLGSEVLLFERTIAAAPSKQFGTPDRNAWGRLSEILESGKTGDVRHLYKEEVVIGREEGDVTFPEDECMSRRHACFSFDGDEATFQDLGSANGSYLRLSGPRLLVSGDRIRIGTRVFRLDA
jgi:pSer/pThr/pTyr-binding forkhead associated (FHA) protein